AALVGVALPAPGPVGGLGVRLLPLEPPRRGGEALQRGLERPLAALAPRPQALLHPQRLGGGELEGEPLDRLALRAAVAEREERLLADVARLRQGALAQAAGAARAAREAGRERGPPGGAVAQLRGQLRGEAVDGGEELAGLEHRLGERQRAADGGDLLERPQGGAARPVDVGEEDLALVAEVRG